MYIQRKKKERKEKNQSQEEKGHFRYRGVNREYIERYLLDKAKLQLTDPRERMLGLLTAAVCTRAPGHWFWVLLGICPPGTDSSFANAAEPFVQHCCPRCAWNQLSRSGLNQSSSGLEFYFDDHTPPNHSSVPCLPSYNSSYMLVHRSSSLTNTS